MHKDEREAHEEAQNEAEWRAARLMGVLFYVDWINLHVAVEGTRWSTCERVNVKMSVGKGAKILRRKRARVCPPSGIYVGGAQDGKKWCGMESGEADGFAMLR